MSLGHLHEYLERLPDFEGFEAERKAGAVAAVRPTSGEPALAFLAKLPGLAAADALVRTRLDELDGRT